MTDNTEKNVSIQSDDCECGWTEEELDQMIGEDTLVKMKCIECGHIADIPDWIVGEFAGENKALGIEGEVEIECPKCNGAMRKIR